MEDGVLLIGLGIWVGVERMEDGVQLNGLGEEETPDLTETGGEASIRLGEEEDPDPTETGGDASMGLGELWEPLTDRLISTVSRFVFLCISLNSSFIALVRHVYIYTTLKAAQRKVGLARDCQLVRTVC